MEEYNWPNDAPSDLVAEPLERNAILTFEDRGGKCCRITSADLITAFLMLDHLGMIPDPGAEWRGAIPQDLHPEGVLNGPVGQIPEHHKKQGTAWVFGAAQNPDEPICPCCGAEIHIMFKDHKDKFLIERWNIVTALLLLIQKGFAPKLPIEWHYQLDWDFERIYQTGRHVVRTCKSQPGDV